MTSAQPFNFDAQAALEKARKNWHASNCYHRYVATNLAEELQRSECSSTYRYHAQVAA